MAIIKNVFILLYVLTTLPSINSQLAAISISLPQIISLLENTTNISPYMPQLAALMKDQKAEQTQMANSLTEIQSTQNSIASTQTQMANSLTEIQSTQNSIASTQTQMANSLTEIQSTQNSIASTQTQMANSLTEIQSTQNSIASTQTQMATTQTQIANAMNQMVSLLQRHDQQLENVTATMTSMMEHQNTQNQILTSLLQIQTERLPLTAQDCTDILHQGFNDSFRIYTIKPENSVSFQVSCDLLTEGGGWIVFQRRFDGSVDFYREWEDYKNGFGELDGEHWLGLEKIHRLTSNGIWQLRIELEDFYGNTSYAQYDNFVIGNETTYYMLGSGAYSGTAGDSLTYNANRAFSTYDQDHDSWSGDNCAQYIQGAWWYGACDYSNLNGPYVGSPVSTNRGMWWYHWKNSVEVLKKAEMKMRRTQ